MADWNALTARAGLECHDLFGWMMWDPRAIAGFEALGVPNGTGWVVAWRLASLGDVTPAAAAATTYSISPMIIDAVMNLYRETTEPDAILEVRNDAVEPGLASIDADLPARLGELADALWRGVDAVHHGARPMFAAHRAAPRPDDDSGLSAWLAANCRRELRGDSHWALCASEDLDDVEVGLLHSAMIDPEEYGGEEWIARSRGGDDETIAAGWTRLEAKGLADAGALNDAGRRFRVDLEARTEALAARGVDDRGARDDAHVLRADRTAPRRVRRPDRRDGRPALDARRAGGEPAHGHVGVPSATWPWMCGASRRVVGT